MNISLTLSGLVVMGLATLAKGADINIDVEALNTTIATMIQLVSIGVIYWGRFRQGDISLLGIKKS